MFRLCPFYQHVRKLDGLVKRVHIDFNAYYEVKVTKQSAEKSLKKQFGSKVRRCAAGTGSRQPAQTSIN
jgi:hypothetical protein